MLCQTSSDNPPSYKKFEGGDILLENHENNLQNQNDRELLRQLSEGDQDFTDYVYLIEEARKLYTDWKKEVQNKTIQIMSETNLKDTQPELLKIIEFMPEKSLKEFITQIRKNIVNLQNKKQAAQKYQIQFLKKEKDFPQNNEALETPKDSDKKEEEQNLIPGLSQVEKLKEGQEKKQIQSQTSESAGIQNTQVEIHEIIWEPSKLKQKFETFIHGSAEAIFICLLGVFCVQIPSAVSVSFFIITNLLQFTMITDIKYRYLYGLIALGINLLCVIAIVIAKSVYLKKLKNHDLTNYTKQSNFLSEIKLLQSLGFQLNCNQGKPKACDKIKLFDKDQVKIPFTIEIDSLGSFNLEILFLFMIFVFGIYMLHQYLKIKKLLNTPWAEINEYRLLEKKANQKKDDDEDELEKNEKKQDLGTSMKINDKLRNEEKKNLEEAKDKYKEKQKQIPKNFIQSSFYYSLNTKFFMSTFALTVVAALTAKSMLDVPSFILILGMCGGYMVRKKISLFYTTYCFFLMYYISFIMFIKICHDCVISISFMQSYLSNKKNIGQKEFNLIVFGSLMFREENQDPNPDLETSKTIYTVSLFLCFFFTLCWRSAKWMEIREKTEKDSGNDYFVFRFIEYIYIRVSEDQQIKKVRELQLIQGESEAEKVQEKKQRIKEDRPKRKLYDEISKKLKKTTDKSTITKLYILWAARFLMALLAYMYHSTAGLINLSWVMASFIFPDQYVYLFSILGMIPLILLEFILIYSNKVAVIKNKEFFKNYGEYFQWKMVSETYEFCLLFLVLALFFFMIGIYFDTVDKNTNTNELLQFFKIRIQNKNYSSFWKYLFVFFRSIHVILLIFLFFKSLTNFNNAKNMGSLVLFVLFISSPKFYRKAGFLLLWFFAFFIIAQYYFSLCWKNFMTPEYNVPILYWLTFFPGKIPEQSELYTQNPFSEQLRSQLYFGFVPNYLDWLILIIVNLVGTINHIFQDDITVEKLNDEIQEIFETQHSTIIYYYRRSLNVLNIIFLFVINIFMIILQLFLAETNFIMWFFFLLSIVGLGQLIRANRSTKEIKKSITISRTIKFYSCFVLVVTILFMIIFGEFRKDGDKAYKQTNDYKLSVAYPTFYKLIPYIGLRSIKYKNIHFSMSESAKSEAQSQLSRNITFYVLILLIAYYLEYYFNDQMKHVEEENKKSDEDYKKLFQYDDQSKIDQQQNKIKEDKEKDQKIKQLSQKDFIAHYEQQRFTRPFFAYRALNFWDKIDTFCTYGHLINNFTIFFIALFRNCSIYLFVNLTIILGFYVLASIRTSRRSRLNQQVSGLQSQCDVTMAKLITKKHKTEAFREFLKLRIRVWYFQFIAFFFALLIGYPTSILSSLRADAYKEAIRKDSSEKGLAAYKNLLDNTIFWSFFTGVFKDETAQNFIQKYQFYTDFLLILFGLFIERNMINWLKDRFGCTYYKFQKFIELDMRREAIRQGWKNQTPNYNIERYRQHYFLNNFDELKQKFLHINYAILIQEKDKSLELENEIITNQDYQLMSSAQAASFQTNLSKQKTQDLEKLDQPKIKQVFALPKSKLQLEYEQNNYGDFIPAKEGIRINDMIKLCLGLECQATNINLDDQSLELLQERIGPNKKNLKESFQKKLEQLNKIKDEQHQNLNYKLYINQIYDLVQRISESPSVVVTDENEKEIESIPSLNSKNFADNLDKQNEEITKLKKISKSQSVDYEGVPILRKYKTEQLRKILKDNIDFKYAVSFAKGNQILIEGIILFMIMLSLCFKCNIFSLVYLLFLIRYPQVNSKSGFMVRLSCYMAVIIFINYALLLFNLTQQISPRKFPEPFQNYPNWDEAVNEQTLPQNQTSFYWEKESDRLKDGINWKLIYPIPFAFQIKVFRRDLLFCYLMGMGVDNQQVYSIFIDLFTIYIVAMYTVTYRNPILSTKMKKVFWQFPQKKQSGYKDRLDPETRKLVDFIYRPVPLYDQAKKQIDVKRETLNSEEEKKQRNINYNDIKLLKRYTEDLSVQQFNFIGEYRKSMKIQLNNILTNYVDITYDDIWSEDFVKEKKREIKNNSVYFRLVKRGSVLIYLTFHIITILVILLMSVTRESILSLGYILILLPSIKDGAEVLKQRELKIEVTIQKKEEKIKEISKYFPNNNYRADIERDLEKEKPKGKKSLIKQDIVEHFLKKDSQISMELDDALKLLDYKKYPEAKQFVDDGNYSEFLQKLKTNQDLRGKENFPQKRYQVMLLLFVHQYTTRLIKGSAEEKTFKDDREKISKIDKEIKELNRQLQARKIKEIQRGKNKKQTKQLEWKFIGTLKNALLTYAFLDFFLSILYQLPSPYTSLDEYGMNSLETIIGLTKIFVFPQKTSQEEFIARNLFSTDKGNLSLILNINNLITQAFNCFIIAFILIQGQIFESTGYQKYINQDNGSMDLLVQLSELKAKSMTYVFNNLKIRKITSVQKHKEKLVAVVENIKGKLQRWRRGNRNLIKLSENDSVSKTNENEQLLAVQKIIAIFQAESKKSQQAKDAELFEMFKKALEGLVKDKEKQIKSVKFDEEVITKEEKKLLENEDDEEHLSEQKIPQQEISEKTDLLIEQLLVQKTKKRGECVRFYLWLHETFTEQILFKNEKSELEEIVKSHASGEIKTQTELEKLMKTELKELVKIHLDSKENNMKFQIAIHKLKKNPEKNTLLELTEMDKKIKFSDMKMSFEFTRSFAMFINYIETVFCILVSQSEAFIYFGMIFSMYMNAGIISLFYPIMAFGYGMLEEKRTGKVFWRWIRWYTTGILLFKFVATLRIAKENFFDGETWKNIQANTLFGVLSEEDGITSTIYMLPEIIIICFIMLNEIKLKLLGLYENRELDIEMITDGIVRIRCKGDEQQIKQRLALQSHSAMEPLMTSCKKQKLIDQEYYASKKRQIQIDLNKKLEINNQYLIEEYNSADRDLCIAIELQKQNPDKNYDCMDYEGLNNLKNKYGKAKQNKQILDQFYKHDLKDEQLQAFKDISLKMWNTAIDFDLDSPGKKTLNDEFIEKKAIQKTLENDFICFVEGLRKSTQISFPSEQQFTNFKFQKENWENMSCGDHEEEVGEKFDQIAERKRNKKGFFDSYPYYDTLFPSLKIQKPGGDWYGCTTLTLSFIALYIFMFFEKYTFDTTRFPFYKKESSLLTGESSITVICIIFIIIVERIANRTDTKSANPEKLDLGKKGDVQKKNFSQDDFILRSQTVRSLTVKLQKTQKTTDLDLNDQGTQNFLENLEMDEEEIDRARTRITKQQKYKYFIHLFMLIGGHIYIFWYIPLKFNKKLHGSARCNKDNTDYGCMNFHTNGYLRGLYVLLIVYLIFSSIQLSQGMPLRRKASSVLQYYSDLGKIGSDCFASIPFAIEIRCAIDYCCSKTSLDFFQTLQLYYYHYTFYTSMLGNAYYLQKKIGRKQTFADKFVCGYLTGILFVSLWVGILFLFSTFSFFITQNPINSASLKFNFVVSNTILMDDNNRIVIKKENEKQSIKQHTVISNMTYNLYINSNPNIKSLSEDEFSNRYQNSTILGHPAYSEHLAFTHDQVQDMLIPAYSEVKWDLSKRVQDYLFQDLSDTVEILDRPDLYNFTLQYDFAFGRAGPVGFEKTNAKINRTLNATNYFDCLTAQDLKSISSLDCTDEKNKDLSKSAIFTNAFIPQIVLGQTREGSELVLSQIQDQKLDVKVKYFCNQTWKIESKNGIADKQSLMEKLKDLTITENLDQYLLVDDIKTCNLAHEKFKDQSIKTEFEKQIKTYREKGQEKNITIDKSSLGDKKYEYLDLHWGKMKFVIFSMFIVTGFIAGSSPTGFIAGTVTVVYAIIKPALILIWGDANIWEGTHHMPLIKLCEAVYMYRHEEDLVNEESTYRMIVEIVRSSEFLKAITGSSLRGDQDPMLDKLDESQKEKLQHLMKLEARGFDVDELKKKIIKTDPNPSGENLFNQDDELK